MALILQLETSTEVCSVALSFSGKTIASEESLEKNSHSEQLTLLIDACFKKTKYTYRDLSAVCISGGPGSYTSLRVGTSVAKGICIALDIPLMVLDSLDILALGIDRRNIAKADFIIPMIDARRMEVYLAVFNGQLDRIKPSEAVILDEDNLKEYKSNQLHICGSGSQKYLEAHHADNVKLHHTATSSVYMSEKAYELFLNHQFQDVAYYTPNYLKSPNITKSSKKLFH